MSYLPATQLSTPYEDYPNQFLKCFVQSTTTPLSMATDAAAGTLLAKAEISGGGTPPIGFLKTAGDAIFQPYLNAAYDAWIFPTAAEADANDTSNAIQIADNVDLQATEGELSAKFSKSFDTVALMVADTTLVVGDIAVTAGYISTGDGGDNSYEVVSAGTGTDDGGSFIDLATHQAKGLFPRAIRSPIQYGMILGTSLTTPQRQANSASLNAAIATGNKIFIPKGIYELNGKISMLTDGQIVEGWGAEFLTYHNDDHAWEMGDNNSDNGRRFQMGLFGIKLDYRGAGWVNGVVGGSNFGGLVLSQPYESRVEGVSSNYYKWLVLHQSAFSASFYNFIHMVEMEYGEVGYFLHAQDVTTDHGLVASNVIMIQRMQQCTSGIVTLGDNGPGQPGENIPGDNLFFHPSIEHGTGTAIVGISEGGANSYIEPRIDGNFSNAFMELTTNSRRASVVSHLFFLKQGTNLLDNGEENHIQLLGYDQVIQANATTLGASLRRTAVNGNVSIREDDLQWTLSGTGTATYYLEQSGGGQTQRDIPRYPPRVLENSGAIPFNDDISSLAAAEWGVGDQDTLGFNTIYVRLADDTDPDSKAAAWLQAKGIALLNQYDEGKFSVSSSQIINQALATGGPDGYFMRGANFNTGEEVYRIPADGGFTFNRRTVPPTPDTGFTMFVNAAGALQAIKDDGTVVTFTVV